MIPKKDELFVIFDSRDFSYLVETPYWNAGTWTNEPERARLHSEESANGILAIHPNWKKMTLVEAKDQETRQTLVRKRFV